MTKKILSLLLALTLCVGLCTVIASAAGTIHEVTDEASLSTALENAVDGDTISLKNDITWESTNKAIIKKGITVEGNGNILTFTASMYGLRIEDVAASGTTIQNLTIISKVANGRCIQFATDGLTDIDINNCVLDASEATGAPQPLTVGGTEADGFTTDLYITGSTIKTSNSGYAILCNIKLDMYIEDCTIEGWNAVYMKAISSDGSADSYVQISDSIINTVNVHSGTTNAFSAIAIEADNVYFDIYNTKFNCEAKGDQPQGVIGLGSEVVPYVTGCEFYIQPDCEIVSENIVNIQTSSNISDNDVYVPAEYAEQLKENGYVVVIEGDYTFPALTQDDFDVLFPEHNPVAVESEVPVCAEGGFITYYVCNEDCCCGMVFSDAEGRVCVADDVDEYEPISAEHTYKRVEKVEATLEAAGMEEHLECEVCGGFFKLTGEPVEENSLVIEKLTSEEETEENTEEETEENTEEETEENTEEETEENTEEKTEEKTEIKNPPTNDDTILAFTVLALVSAATVIVVARKKANN